MQVQEVAPVPSPSEAVHSPINTSAPVVLQVTAELGPQLDAAQHDGGYKPPPAKKPSGFVFPGSNVPTVSPQQESKTKGATPATKALLKKSAMPKKHSVDGNGKKDTKSAKKSKDPNAPKRSPSAYLLFSKEQCAKLKEADPTQPQSAIVKAVSVLWNKASELDKAPYATEASSLKEAYRLALAKYQEENPHVSAASTLPSGDTRRGKDKQMKKKKVKIMKISKADTGEHQDDDDGGDDCDLTAGDGAAEEVLFLGTHEDTPIDEARMELSSTHALFRGTMRKAGQAAQVSMKKLTKLEQSGVIQATTGFDNEEKTPSKNGFSRKRNHASSKGENISIKSGGSDTSTRVAQRQKKNIERSNMSATAIPSLDGIKQANLPPSDDLLHAKLRISHTGEYPEDFVPCVNDHACLVLAPYREFLQSLTARPCPVVLDREIDCNKEGLPGTCAGAGVSVTVASLLGLSDKDLSLIELVTTTAASSDSEDLNTPNILSNCIISGVRALDNCQHSSFGACALVDLTTAAEGGAVKAFTILYVPFSSACLTVDPFLLDQTAFQASLQSPWLQVGAQISRCFANPVENDYGSGDQIIANARTLDERTTKEGRMECVWLEGQVYAVRRDIASDPYQSVKVVWLSQDLDDEEDSWVYAYCQTDNLCSPWDLQPSRFVHPDHHQLSKRAALPRSLTVGNLLAASVLDYVSTWDAASVFRYDLGSQAQEEFLSMFPDKRDHLDLATIIEWATQGRYDGAHADSTGSSDAASLHSMGISTLFRDLERMVHVGLRFNECNRNFLPWRQAEMTQQALSDLKLKLSEAHPHLSCLRTAVLEDAKLVSSREEAKDRDLLEV